jgi:hypothetical protein
MRTDITAINARTISINGVPIAGSGNPTGPYTTFDQLDADAPLYLNGVLIQGTPIAGQVITNYTDVNVLSGVSEADVVRYGTPSTPATNAFTGPVSGFGSVVIPGGIPPLPAVTLYLAATRAQVPQIRYVSGTSPATSANVVAQGRKSYPGLAVAQNKLVIRYSGFISSLSSGEAPGVELDVGNAQSVQVALEFNGQTVQATFSGQQIGSIPSGAVAYDSDPIPASAFGLSQFPANTPFWVREYREVPVGGYIARYGSAAGMTGERQMTGATGLASQLLATGAMTGGTDAQMYYGPTAIMGDVPCVALVNIGDSINNGANEASPTPNQDGSAGGGYIMRAAFNVGGSPLPVLNMAANGTQVQQFVSANTKRLALIKACNITIANDNFGTNDIGTGGRTGAQVWTDRQTAWASLRANGITTIIGESILVRTTSTDSFVTATNQTVNTNYETGGTGRSVVNTNLRSTVGQSGGVDILFDTDKMVRDATFPDKWRFNGVASAWTDDGTHPVSATHVILGQAFNAVLATLTRPGVPAFTITYNATANALFARMATPPNAALKKALSDLYAGATAAAIPLDATGPFDAVYLPLHNEADASLNLVGANYTLTKGGTTNFTPYRSFRSDGTTGFYGTGFNPATATSPKFVQDNAGLGKITYTDTQEIGEEIGHSTARIGSRNTAGQLNVRDNTSVGYTPAIGDSLGVVNLSRTSSASYDIYKDRPAFGNRATASVAVTSANMEIARVGTNYSTREIGGAWIGRGLTATEYGAWYDLVTAFNAKLARLAA